MERIFLKLAGMSFAAAIIVIAVLALRLLLRGCPKWIFCLMWGLVALRLLLFVPVRSSVSLIPEAVSAPVTAYTAPVLPGPSTSPAPPAEGHDPAEEHAPEEERTAPEGDGGISLLTVAAWVWLGGAAAMAVLGGVSLALVRRRAALSVPVEEGVRRGDLIDSPFVLGLLRPAIYLPRSLPPQDIPYILAHERRHIRRRDNWWKPLGFLLLTVHWMNPLMWLAYCLFCRDVEGACDEAVIRDMDLEGRRAYSAAILNSSVRRRSLALGFGGSGVKARIKGVMNYKRPAFWLILLALLAASAAAVCLLTDPVGLRLDFSQNPIVSAVCVDLREPERARDMNTAQIDELQSRLRDVKKTRRSDEYGGFSPMYQVTARLRDGGFILVNGYAADRDMVDIVADGTRYITADADFTAYLRRVCAYGDTAPAQDVDEVSPPRDGAAEPGAVMWFDYLANRDAVDRDGELTAEAPEFPGVTFKYTGVEISALTQDGETPLIGGMPIWNAFFSDLNGDGYPEICACVSFGSGVVDNRVAVCDYKNGGYFELAERMMYDYTLRLGGSGELLVDQRSYGQDDLIMTARPLILDGALALTGQVYTDTWHTALCTTVAPGETARSIFTVDVTEGMTVELSLGWVRSGLFLEYGLEDENGKKYSQTNAGSVGNAAFDSLPAGRYTIFARNCEEKYLDYSTYKDPEARERVGYDANLVMNYHLSRQVI